MQSTVSAMHSTELFDSKDIVILDIRPKTDYEKYFALIHKAFSQKRKMLRKTLPKELLEKAGIDSTRRPETLTLKEWGMINNPLSSVLFYK